MPTADLAEIKKLILDQNEALKENCEKTDEIHFAIFGNERAGIKGMAKTQVDHSRTIAEYKRLKWMGLGVAAVSGGGFVAWLKSTFGG